MSLSCQYFHREHCFTVRTFALVMRRRKTDNVIDVYTSLSYIRVDGGGLRPV